MNGKNELGRLLEFLAEPLEPTEVQFKIQSTNRDRTRGLVVAYVDAQRVQDRLDAAVRAGLLEDWWAEYEVKERTSAEEGETVYVVEAVLTLRLPSGRETSRRDVGEGDSLKAAYSDAFKRAAVQFGIARYLYSVEKEWVRLENGGLPKEEERRLRSKLPRPGGGARELLPREAAQAQAPAPAAEKPLEERLKEADAFVAKLAERLKREGRAKEVVEILLRHGYKLGDPGSTEEDLERARAVYRELRSLTSAA